jgi:hypothetical protein
MAWLIGGGATLCLAPCIGALVIGGLLAFHELRARAALRPGAGKRARTDLLEEFLDESAPAVVRPQRRRSPRRALARRASPALLIEHLEERQPKPVARPWRLPQPTGRRQARPTRLVPLTA